jgi:hypothetical protein
MLVPHGPWLLLGNPNQPHGLRLVHRDQIPNLDDYIRRRRPPTLEELGLTPAAATAPTIATTRTVPLPSSVVTVPEEHHRTSRSAGPMTTPT